jgi:hypothetical protein
MRLLVFTLLAIAVSVGLQLGVGELPYNVSDAMHGIDAALFFLSPVIVTAVLARAMRIPNTGYVIFLAVASPFACFAIFAYIRVTFLHDNLL